jgi:hypothetical protein
LPGASGWCIVNRDHPFERALLEAHRLAKVARYSESRRTQMVRMRYVFVIAFLVAFVGLSLLADRSARGRSVVTGTIIAWRAAESIRVANEFTDPTANGMKLRPNTVIEGDTRTIKPGVRVTVWYRSVGERRLVVDRVRVLDAAGY